MRLRQCTYLTISILSFSIVGVLSGGAAAAQDGASESDNDWQYSAAVYLWAADIGGRT